MKTKTYAISSGKTRYLFLLPAFIVYCSIIIIPSFYSLFLSFFKWNGVSPKKTFVGLNNYIYVLTQDKVFWIAAKNNIIWIVLTISCTVVIALFFALLINKNFAGRTLLRGVLYFPYVLSGVMVAIAWQWIYHPQMGLLNTIFEMIGKPQWTYPWLGEVKTAFFATYIAAFWHYTGAPMVLFLAGLQTIPQELSEAAKIDGANKVQVFFNVTIPMLKETFVIVLATQIISSMKVYDIIYAMTGGGPAQSTQTLATWMVTQTFTFANIGYGTAISWIMVLIMMFVVIPYVAYTAEN